MDEKTNHAYAERFNRVIDFIDHHLDEALTVDRLSQVACFSKYHFHRQFSGFMGISVTRLIQRKRLKRAAYRLAFNPTHKIIDIALDAGFENPESFSRAFKKAYGQTPSQFRKEPQWEAMPPDQTKRKMEEDMQVQIINFEEIRVAALTHQGAPDRVNETVARFIAWRKTSGLSPIKTSHTFGIPYNDPNTVAAEDYRFDVCGSIEAEVEENPQGVVSKVIPGGRCARLRHHGSWAGLEDAVRFLYGQWLPASDETLRDFPCFFRYVNLFPQVAEHELITDIYLPLT